MTITLLYYELQIYYLLAGVPWDWKSISRVPSCKKRLRKAGLKIAGWAQCLRCNIGNEPTRKIKIVITCEFMKRCRTATHSLYLGLFFSLAALNQSFTLPISTNMLAKCLPSKWTKTQLQSVPRKVVTLPLGAGILLSHSTEKAKPVNHSPHTSAHPVTVTPYCSFSKLAAEACCWNKGATLFQILFNPPGTQIRSLSHWCTFAMLF